MDSMITTIPLTNLKNVFLDKYALICCASFESRCLSIPTRIAENINHAIIYRNCSDDFSATTNHCIALEKSFFCPAVSNIPFDHPEIVAGYMAKDIEHLANISNKLLIDITTFTHETLLILLRTIYLYKSHFDSIFCLYNGAREYSPGNSPENTWLSKGCKDVRNVIGYPGIMRPIAKTTLVVLTGFELERATKLIELVDPDCLVLGNGIDPVNETISSTMTFFREKYDAWKEEYNNIEKNDFEFSCKDIPKTVHTLSQIISQTPEDNYIIVPLNTKLSTVSAAIVALENRKVQLCCAVPETYNFENYSSPGETATIVNIKGFSVFS